MPERSPVRALARGLDVLAALNRLGPAATTSAVAASAGLPRPTAHRLLATLAAAGYAARSAGGEAWRLLHRVRTLSDGFDDAPWVAEAAAPAMAALTGRTGWPCDVSTPEGLAMVVRESTHRQGGALTLDRGMVGTRLPLLGTATGHAYLAAIPDAERARLLGLLAAPGAPGGPDAAAAARALARTRRQGFGARTGGQGGRWGHSSAVSLPVRTPDGRVAACLTLIWIARAMGLAEAVRRHMSALRATQVEIEAALARA